MTERYDVGEGFCTSYHHTVELIGRRWTGAILRELLRGTIRFGQIREAIPQLTDKMLASRLRELENEGIVRRIVLPQIPVRVEYHLTDKGRDLESVVAALSQWADRWIAPDSESSVAHSASG